MWPPIAAVHESGSGTFVWTGRALQAGFDDLETIVLRFCIRPLSEAASLLAIMDIRAHPISFSERPRKAASATRSRMRRRDRFSISSIQLADLGRVNLYIPRCVRISLGHPLGGSRTR